MKNYGILIKKNCVVNQFFPANIKLDKILLSVLDGTNAISWKKNGL